MLWGREETLTMSTMHTDTNDSFTERLQVVEARFECPICLNCLKDPVLTSCGHRFCRECIHEWLKHKSGGCPVDGQSLALDSDLFPDNYTRREIAQHMISCPVEDCSQQLSLSEAEKHMAECHQVGMTEQGSALCTFQNVGCSAKFESLTELNSHLDEHLHRHLALLTTAYSRFSYVSVQSQSKSQESQMWDPDPKHNEKNGEATHWQGLIRSLYERIVLLEQSSREQEIKLTQLKEENLQLKLEYTSRLCGGVYVWVVNNFSHRYATMKQDPNTMFYSPGFYTSYAGYRFCARMNACVHDPNHMALLVHIMQGENDNVLDWPFSGRITLTIVHPIYFEKSVKETMMSRPELDAFRRPLREINTRAFGYNEFVKFSEIFSEGFVKNDTLTIKIQIQTV